MARCERGPARAQPERRHHQAGVAEHRLGLHQPEAFGSTHDGVGLDPHVLQRQRGGVARPDAVLVLGLAVGEPGGVALDDEPGRSTGRPGEHGVHVGVAAVRDPLLVPVQQVAHDLVVLDDRLGGGPHRGQIAAGLRFRGPVRHEQAFVGDAGHPPLLLLRGAAEHDRVAAQEGGQHAGRDAHVDGGQLLADAVDVHRVAAHPAELLADEQQRHPEPVAAHLPHDVLRELVGGVELAQLGVGKVASRVLADGIQHHVQVIPVEAHRHEGTSLARGYCHPPPRGHDPLGL